MQDSSQRAEDPLGLFKRLLHDSQGDLDAERSRLLALRDKEEEPARALSEAKELINRREFAQARDRLSRASQLVPGRHDLGELQEIASELAGLQRLHEVVRVFDGGPTFVSVRELVHEAQRVAQAVPQEYAPYALSVLEVVKSRQLVRLDSMVQPPSDFIATARWLRTTWPGDAQAEDQIKTAVQRVVDEAAHAVDDVDAERFPGSVEGWQSFVEAARKGYEWLEILIREGFVPTDTIHLTKETLTQLEERQTRVRRLDARARQVELTDDERREALQIAKSAGLVRLSDNRLVDEEMRLLEGQIRKREREKRQSKLSLRIEQLVDDLTDAKSPVLMLKHVETAQQELQELHADSTLLVWLDTALENLPRINERYNQVERICRELNQPKAMLISVGHEVAQAQEAYAWTNDSLSKLVAEWPDTARRPVLQLPQPRPWDEYWRDRSLALQRCLPDTSRIENLQVEDVTWVMHLLPLLEECSANSRDDALEQLTQKLREKLPALWRDQLHRTGFFDIAVAGRRIADALLDQSQRQEDNLAAAWLAMLALAAGTTENPDAEVAKPALDMLNREEIAASMQKTLDELPVLKRHEEALAALEQQCESIKKLIDHHTKRLQDKIAAGDHKLQAQLTDLEKAPQKKAEAYREQVRQSLHRALAEDAIDIPTMQRLLAILRRIPAEVAIRDLGLEQELRGYWIQFGSKYAQEQGSAKSMAQVLYGEFATLLEGTSSWEGGSNG